MPLPANSACPVKNAAKDDAIPVTAATATALAARTETRCGASANVDRMDPVAYSPVMTTTPSTPIASWARKNPLRL